MTVTLFPTNRPFDKAREDRSPRWRPPRGAESVPHKMDQSGVCYTEGEEGCFQLGGAHVRWQLESASACLQGVRRFDDRLFHPAANEQSLCQQCLWGAGWPTAHLLPELLCHRLSWLFRNCQTLASWAKKMPCKLKVGDKDAFIFLPPTRHLFSPLNLNIS